MTILTSPDASVFLGVDIDDEPHAEATHQAIDPRSDRGVGHTETLRKSHEGGPGVCLERVEDLQVDFV